MAIAAMAVFLILLTTPGMGLAQQVVKIAVAIPLTGQLARDGQGAAHAVHLAADEWNQKGGVLGRRIEVVDADDQANPQVAVSAAEKVIADPGILGVLWGITSSTCIPVSDLTERAGLVMVSPGCGNPKLTERGLKTVFRMIRGMMFKVLPARYSQLITYTLRRLRPSMMALLGPAASRTRWRSKQRLLAPQVRATPSGRAGRTSTLS